MSPPARPAAGEAFARRLNLGCGSRYRDDWTNVDVRSAPGVLAHDLRDPLPFADASYDFVYHSHVLEHFRPADVPAFLRECRRVLRPGGTLRVVVPDLEGVVRGYLAALDRCADDDDGSAERTAAERDLYWMTLELYDQTTRERSGGRMGDLLRSADVPNERFIRERCGMEVAHWLDARGKAPAGPTGDAAPRRSPWRRAAGAVRRGLRALGGRALTERALGSIDREALRIGRFRLAGEVHQWMYDRVSLARTLREAGFVEPIRRGAGESAWDGWADQRLDAEADGTIYKPDSLFMEATRPAPPAAGDRPGDQAGRTA
ncbi:class I SAM-dependent methyltransferase [Alienimonas californiensis]|uniref:Methyltransferase type 11 domain-containing protein n=1 Tax=Alienimonas californiensis TaxID=2527989 RepID=A0A517P874_9PLAN|nr:methyltransferase domain-containing protein [Alienimonas californiensis]QDT15545.1 hypothetical protein CA12_16300 [Alienimonas californiensis]